MAPCAHVWHYKCIRPVLEGKNSTFPNFNCPNCRAYSDLSVDVDIEPEDFDEEMSDVENGAGEEDPDVVDSARENGQSDADAAFTTNGAAAEAADADQNNQASAGNDKTSNEPMAPPNRTPSLSGSSLLSRRQAANPASAEIGSMNGIPMPQRYDPDETTNELQPEITRTGSPDAIISGEGPLTPRNNAGPFVFDGSAGRPSSGRRLTASAIGEDED